MEESVSLVKRVVDRVYAARKKFTKDKADLVNWWAYNANGTMVEGGDACYMDIMSHLPEQDVHLRPYEDRNSCHIMRLIPFLALCRAEGLIVPDAGIVNDNGKVGLYIPRGHDHHAVYVSLAMYRHSDVNAKSIVMPTMELYRSLRHHGISFWQCMYYAMQRASIAGEYTNFQGHSFVDLNDSAYGVRKEGGSQKRMGPGVAVALWLNTEPAIRTLLCGAVKPKDTIKMMQWFENKLQPLPMSDPVEILDPANNHRFHNPSALLVKPLKE